jgi:molybdopterin converting factor small subunit
MSTGTIRYWAAAKDAAGVAQERYDGATLAEVLAAAAATHGDQLRNVLTRCSFLIDDAPVGGRDHGTVRLADGSTIEVLPPFAGG